MPLFEFKCKVCHRNFEELIRNEADFQALKCPHCSSKDVEKLLSPFGFSCGSSIVTSVSSGSSACSTCTARSCDTCG